MEIKRLNSGEYEVLYGTYNAYSLTVSENEGWYYVKGYEFDSFDSAMDYCNSVDMCQIAFDNCRGWFFNDSGTISRNGNIFEIAYDSYSVYLENKEQIELFKEFTELAVDCGILNHSYDPSKFTTEDYLILDLCSDYTPHEYDSADNADYLINVFKTLLKK